MSATKKSSNIIKFSKCNFKKKKQKFIKRPKYLIKRFEIRNYLKNDDISSSDDDDELLSDYQDDDIQMEPSKSEYLESKIFNTLHECIKTLNKIEKSIKKS